MIILANLLFLLPPKIIGNTIDLIQNGKITGDLLHSKVTFLISLSVGLYVIMVIYTNLLFGNAMLLEKLLKSKLFNHIMKMGHSFFQRNRSGDIIALSTNDLAAVVNTAGPGTLLLINTVIGFFSVIIAMIFLVDYRLMIASIIPLPILAFVIGRIGESMRRQLVSAQAAFGKMNNHALESISGLRVLRAYVQEEQDLDTFENITKDVLSKNKKVAFRSAMIQPVILIIVGFSYVIGIGYGAYLVFHNQITLGQLITFNIYLGLLIWPMISFGDLVDLIKRGSASLERIENVFDQNVDVVEKDTTLNISKPTSIVFKNLSFKYPDTQIESLKSINVKIQKGQTLGIVGRTGSGKSTFLKQLLKQYPIEENQVFISDIPIELLPTENIRKWIGYVPQEHLFLSRTIKDNIAFGKKDASMEEINKVIKTTCLTDDIEQMRNGMDTVIGEGGVMLSGGQKQRLSIARALLIDPEILILDDVLSAVDAKTESEILFNLKQQRVGKTTLISTHRLATISHADWIIVLDNGKIIEEGTHNELVNNNTWYKQQYYNQQLEAELLNMEKDVSYDKQSNT